MNLLHKAGYAVLDTNPSIKKLLPKDLRMQERPVESCKLPKDLQEFLGKLEKTRFQSPNEVKCQYCGEATVYHGGDIIYRCAEVCNGDGIILVGNQSYGIDCVSNHRYNDEWFICEKCTSFHLKCPRCPGTTIQLCRFLGFEGVFSFYSCRLKIRLPPVEILQEKYSCSGKDLQQYIQHQQSTQHVDSYSIEFLDEENTARFIQDYPTKYAFPAYYVGDQDRYYAGGIPAGVESEVLTGFNGGSTHQWKCPRCQSHYNITDK